MFHKKKTTSRSQYEVNWNKKQENNIIVTSIQAGSDSCLISRLEKSKFHKDLKGKEQNSRHKWRERNTR